MKNREPKKTVREVNQSKGLSITMKKGGISPSPSVSMCNASALENTHATLLSGLFLWAMWKVFLMRLQLQALLGHKKPKYVNLYDCDHSLPLNSHPLISSNLPKM